MSVKAARSFVLLVISASACGGSAVPTTPTPPSPVPPSSAGAVLSGRVTDRATSAPIAGARVTASYPGNLSATTDGLGNYRLNGLPAHFAIVWATADNYEADVHYFRSESQDFRPYPIKRIAPGNSALVTVSPDDPLCANNMTSPGEGADYVCQIVRIVAPIDGTMTLEAMPLDGGERPLLVVEAGWGQPRCCSQRLENPTSIKVTAGTEVIAHVEMATSSTANRSFTLNTSMAAR